MLIFNRHEDRTACCMEEITMWEVSRAQLPQKNHLLQIRLERLPLLNGSSEGLRRNANRQAEGRSAPIKIPEEGYTTPACSSLRRAPYRLAMRKL